MANHHFSIHCILLITFGLIIGCSESKNPIINESKLHPAKILKANTKGKINALAITENGDKVVFETQIISDGLIQLNTNDDSMIKIDSPINYTYGMASWSTDGTKLAAISTKLIDGKYSTSEMNVIILNAENWAKEYKSTIAGVNLFPEISENKNGIYYFKGEARKTGATIGSNYDLFHIDIQTNIETKLTNFEFYQISKMGLLNGVLYFSGIPNQKSKEKKDATSPNLYQYNIHQQSLNKIPIKENDFNIKEIFAPKITKSGNLYFMGGSLPKTPPIGNYIWHIYKIKSDTKEVERVLQANEPSNYEITKDEKTIIIPSYRMGSAEFNFYTVN